MELSRMRLNISKVHTIQALQNPNIFHGAIENAFHGEDVIWRIDQLRGDYYLMLVSEAPFDSQVLIQQFGYKDEKIQSVDYAKVMNVIKEGTVWHFRLVANPTIAIMDSKKESKRGKRVACLNDKSQIEWLLKRCANFGCDIDANQLRISEKRWIRFKKKDGNHRVSIYSVAYEGYLKVVDPELLKKKMVEGLGHGKAYGLGMLTVMKG